jgi:hypothetical protein
MVLADLGPRQQQIELLFRGTAVAEAKGRRIGG